MARIAGACPIDPLRPHIQLQTFLKSLATPPHALERNEMQKKGIDKSMQGIKRPWWKVVFGIW
ncbi:hypothetical protein B0H14DRAFT_2716518 [Mycena olivaceomarginata]|nr:hypothetical protein B0H14DRAFT_2716518 [Mycena olivaceomarginata]